MSEITGKTLIITGASRGIGHALALELADEGVNLVLNARTPEPLEKTAAECRKVGVRVEFEPGSAASEAVAARLVDMALGMGNFYGFIQVAGVLRPGPLVTELFPDEFQDIFEASVLASFQMARTAFPHLRGGGLAVFFGSGAAESVVPGLGSYCAAKAAEEHLARQLAAEAPWITTFAFRPGVVDTRMIRDLSKARGGAAETVHRQFRQYKERGEILPPQVPAKALTAILKSNPRRFHGRVAGWRDGAESGTEWSRAV